MEEEVGTLTNTLVLERDARLLHEASSSFEVIREVLVDMLKDAVVLAHHAPLRRHTACFENHQRVDSGGRHDVGNLDT
jgi:hypothetical protein